MPKCTAERMEFGRVGRRVIEADFTGGAMGSEGGVLKLEVDWASAPVPTRFWPIG